MAATRPQCRPRAQAGACVMLTVLNVAYPLAPVGPNAVGGAEQILSALDRALVRAGHRSLVIACEGSEAAGTLLSVAAEAHRLDEQAKRRGHGRHPSAIAHARRRFEVGGVHLHGIGFDGYLPQDGPTLVPLHLPLDWYAPGAFVPARDDLWLHCVSPSQQGRAPAGAVLRAPIQNGVDAPALAGRHARRSFALVLSRVCPEKGIHVAIDAAKL